MNNKPANRGEKVVAKPEVSPDSTYSEYWCSSEILKKTQDSIEKLESNTVTEFLATFHKGCTAIVEYSEWSNELLFEVASRQPDLLLQLLFNDRSLDKEAVLSEFESPIKDLVDLDGLMATMNGANSPEEIRAEVLRALNTAKSKH